MELDRTHIRIRLRSMTEVGDLTLVILRNYPTALFSMFALGASFWILVDLLVLGWIPIAENQYGLTDEEALPELMRYAFWMVTLVFLQTPAAGVLSTLYLGLAVFEQRPSLGNVWKESKRSFWRWFWKLGVVRMAFPPVIVLMLRWGQPASVFWDVTLPVFLILYAAAVRSMRPYLPEILLLEQCPLKAQAPNAITAAKRSKSLHSPMANDLSARFVATSLFLTMLCLSIGFSILSLLGVTTGQWGVFRLTVLLGVFPLTLWIVAGLSIFVRLLNYLDCRIRLEGWEVELAIRAEAIRQFGEERDIQPKDVSRDSRTKQLDISTKKGTSTSPSIDPLPTDLPNTVDGGTS